MPRTYKYWPTNAQRAPKDAPQYTLTKHADYYHKRNGIGKVVSDETDEHGHIQVPLAR